MSETSELPTSFEKFIQENEDCMTTDKELLPDYIPNNCEGCGADKDVIIKYCGGGFLCDCCGHKYPEPTRTQSDTAGIIKGLRMAAEIAHACHDATSAGLVGDMIKEKADKLEKERG